MEPIRFSLRRLIKLSLQYLAVLAASIPAGLTYLWLLKLTGNQNVSLVMSVSIGIVLANLAWKALDQRLHTIEKPRQIYQTASTTAGNYYAFDKSMRVATASMALYLIACPITRPRSIFVSMSDKPGTVTSTSLN
jgi:hypothetical protein